jgi:hypothetical protein
MEWFIETRFGDPVLSIDIQGSQIVYGSALGQVGFLNIANKEQFLLTEIAEESIKGIHITEEKIIYASVGDLYVLVLFRNESGDWHMEGVCHEGREHTNLLCGFTQVLQHKSKTCLLVIEEDQETLASIRAEGKNKLIITNSASGEHEEYAGLIFPRFSVPFYFNSDKLLWLERDLSGNRALKLISFSPLNHVTVKYMNKSFGNIACPYVFQDCIIFIHEFKQIKAMEIASGEIISTIGLHNSEVLAIYPAMVCVPPVIERNSQEQNMLVMKALVISVDKTAHICLWQEGSLMEVIDLTKIEGISVDSADRFFGMGYPYVLKASGIHIVVSTDVGILIVKSEYLKCIGGIDPSNNYTNNV